MDGPSDSALATIHDWLEIGLPRVWHDCLPSFPTSHTTHCPTAFYILLCHIFLPTSLLNMSEQPLHSLSHVTQSQGSLSRQGTGIGKQPLCSDSEELRADVAGNGSQAPNQAHNMSEGSCNQIQPSKKDTQMTQVSFSQLGVYFVSH